MILHTTRSDLRGVASNPTGSNPNSCPLLSYHFRKIRGRTTQFWGWQKVLVQGKSGRFCRTVSCAFWHRDRHCILSILLCPMWKDNQQRCKLEVAHENNKSNGLLSKGHSMQINPKMIYTTLLVKLLIIWKCMRCRTNIMESFWNHYIPLQLLPFPDLCTASQHNFCVSCWLP